MRTTQDFNHWFMATDLPGSTIGAAHLAWLEGAGYLLCPICDEQVYKTIKGQKFCSIGCYGIDLVGGGAG